MITRRNFIKSASSLPLVGLFPISLFGSEEVNNTRLVLAKPQHTMYRLICEVLRNYPITKYPKVQYKIKSRDINYVLDFAIPQIKLAIECDGDHYVRKGMWAKEEGKKTTSKAVEYTTLDRAFKDAFLRSQDWQSLNFTHQEIKDQQEWVKEKIALFIDIRGP